MRIWQVVLNIGFLVARIAVADDRIVLIMNVRAWNLGVDSRGAGGSSAIDSAVVTVAMPPLIVWSSTELYLVVVVNTNREMPTLWILAGRSLNQVPAAPHLSNNVVELSLIKWEPAIESLQTLPLRSFIHAHSYPE